MTKKTINPKAYTSSLPIFNSDTCQIPGWCANGFPLPFFLRGTRVPSSPSSPPPPPPPPMAALSGDFTVDELDVAGILLRLPELIRVPFHLLQWGGHGRRSAGDQARRLAQPSAACDEKPVGAGDGWNSPDTPLQFTASEDGDDEGPPRKKPRKIFKKVGLVAYLARSLACLLLLSPFLGLVKMESFGDLSVDRVFLCSRTRR